MVAAGACLGEAMRIGLIKGLPPTSFWFVRVMVFSFCAPLGLPLLLIFLMPFLLLFRDPDLDWEVSHMKLVS